MNVFTKHDTQNLHGMRATLNALRTHVGTVEVDTDRSEWAVAHDHRAIGRLQHCLEVAEEAIFDVLNCAASYCHDPAAEESFTR